MTSKTQGPKTLHDAKLRIAELEQQLAGRPTPGKPASPQKPANPSNPKPTKPFGSATDAVKAVSNVLSGKLSIEGVRADIQAAGTIKEKLLVITQVQDNIKAAIADCKADMAAAAPLRRALLEAQTEEAHVRLAQEIADGPRASRARALLERRGLA